MRSLSAADADPVKISARASRMMTSSLVNNPVLKMLKKLPFPGRFEPLELLERFELANPTSWNRELLENVYGFLWRFKNRGGDISGFVSRHQARRRPLTFLPLAQECRVLSHRLERLP